MGTDFVVYRHELTSSGLKTLSFVDHIVMRRPFLTQGNCVAIEHFRVLHLSCRVLRRTISLLLTFATASIFSAAVAQPPVQDIPEDTVAYLLVIDHSASMLRPISAANREIRWNSMQAQAIEFVRTLPLKSHLWLAIFSDQPVVPEVPQFETEEDRQALISRLQTYAPPVGGTHLFDTLGLAFEQAQQLSVNRPNQHVAVLVYTDGRDEGSQKYRTLKDVENQIPGLILRNKNVYLWWTPIGDEGASKPNGFSTASFKAPVHVSITPSSVVLRNPRQAPEQSLRLVLNCSPKAESVVEGQSIEMHFKPDEPGSIQLDLNPLLWKQGPVSVPVKVVDAERLDANKEYSGRIVFTYPDLPNNRFQGPLEIGVKFRPGDKPEIVSLLPKPNTTFPVGAEVLFFAETLQDARVQWDLGDGLQKLGSEVRFRFETVGPRSIKVTVSGVAGVDPVVREIPINVIDVGLNLDPIAGVVMADQLCHLSCKQRGQVERMDWVIDGRVYPATPRSDSKPGVEIDFQFTPGEHQIVCKGFVRGLATDAAELPVYTEPYALTVVAMPTLQIAQPQDQSHLIFGQEQTFRAMLTGPAKSVIWKIVSSKDSDKPLATIETPAVNSGNGVVSELKYTFAEHPPIMKAEVIATLQPNTGITIPDVVAISNIIVEYAPFKGEIVVPALVPYPFSKQPVQFDLKANQSIPSIQWTFGGSQVQTFGEKSPSVTFPGSGVFPVKAVVTDKGGRETQLTTKVHVAAEPPGASAKIRIGNNDVSFTRKGSIVFLDSSESKGDIAKREWLVDGTVVGSGDKSHVFDTTGSKDVKLVVYGPPVFNPDGSMAESLAQAVPLKFDVYQPVNAINMWPTLVAIAGLGLLLMYYVLGNGPTRWRLYYDHSKNASRDESPRVLVSRYWSRWTKTARIPFHKLFPDDDEGATYWKSGGGQREYVDVTTRKKLRSNSGGFLRYSGNGLQEYQCESANRTDREVTERWRDRRCPSKLHQQMHLLLDTESRGFDTGLLVSFAAAVASVAAVAVTWIWFHQLQF